MKPVIGVKPFIRRKVISDDWTGGLHRRLAGRDDANRLAIVLGPVQSVIRVVDPHVPPMSVEWAQQQAGSYTDFRGNRCVINPLPVLENRLDPSDQVDVCIGQALHEASHGKHTRGLWYSTLLRPRRKHGTARHDDVEEPAFEPLRVAVWLLNIAEDVRVEGLTAVEWPGFAAYFERLTDWLWDERDRLSDGDVPSALQQRLRTAFLGARFYDRAIAVATPEDAMEMTWWHGWIDDYSSGRADAPETVRRGLARLAEDPQANAEMSAMTVEDRLRRQAEETLSGLVNRMIREGIDGVPGCVADMAERSGIDRDVWAAVEQAVREGLERVTPMVVGNGQRLPSMRHRKPLESRASRRAFIGKPDPATEAMRAALVFRQERPRHDLKLQRQGELDDEELWRWAAGDDRLFTERVVEDRPDVALGMLVDISGSMIHSANGETKVRTAQRLAQILLAAASDTEGVTPVVWAHTGDSDAGDGADVFTIWEPGDPATRLGLIGSLDNGNNYDALAVWYCADRLRQMEQPQKVLLVLSDGLPSGRDYGGRPGRAQVRQVVDWAAGQGVTVIQIAIDDDIRPAEQAEMYREWVPYRSARQLPRDLTRILARYAR